MPQLWNRLQGSRTQYHWTHPSRGRRPGHSPFPGIWQRRRGWWQSCYWKVFTFGMNPVGFFCKSYILGHFAYIQSSSMKGVSNQGYKVSLISYWWHVLVKKLWSVSLYRISLCLCLFWYLVLLGRSPRDWSLQVPSGPKFLSGGWMTRTSWEDSRALRYKWKCICSTLTYVINHTYTVCEHGWWWWLCLLKSATVMFTKAIDFIFYVLYESISATFK